VGIAAAVRENVYLMVSTGVTYSLGKVASGAAYCSLGAL